MRKVIIFIVIVIIVFVVYGHLSGKDDSNTTLGIVVNKEVNPYRIVLKVDDTTNFENEVEIEIKDQNLWNLIETDTCYFVTYSCKEPGAAKLDYIEIRNNLADEQEENHDQTKNTSIGDLESYISSKLLEQGLIS